MVSTKYSTVNLNTGFNPIFFGLNWDADLKGCRLKQETTVLQRICCLPRLYLYFFDYQINSPQPPLNHNHALWHKWIRQLHLLPICRRQRSLLVRHQCWWDWCSCWKPEIQSYCQQHVGWCTDDSKPQKKKYVICKHYQPSVNHQRKSEPAKNHMNKCCNFCTAMNGME